MAKGGDARGRPGRPRRPARDAASRRSAKASSAKPVGKSTTPPAPPPPPEPMPARFVLGAIPGATVGGWIDAWRERMPQTELELRPLAVADQRAELLSGLLDAALVRLPIDAAGLSVIPLYDEIAVVVCAADSHLTVAEQLELADLAGEVLVVAQDDVLHLVVPGTVSPSFPAPEDTEQAIATVVAAGVGIVIMPMSLARLHRRRDAAYRPLRDAPLSRVALAWPAKRTTPVVDAFVGIVRGRTANSSRG